MKTTMKCFRLPTKINSDMIINPRHLRRHEVWITKESLHKWTIIYLSLKNACVLQTVVGHDIETMKLFSILRITAPTGEATMCRSKHSLLIIHINMKPYPATETWFIKLKDSSASPFSHTIIHLWNWWQWLKAFLIMDKEKLWFTLKQSLKLKWEIQIGISFHKQLVRLLTAMYH